MNVNYCADLIVVAELGTPDAAVLLVRRGMDSDAFPGWWALPGGEVEPGEISRVAAFRETEEETGIAIDPAGVPTKFVGLYDAPDRDPRGRVVSAAWFAALGSRVEPTAGDDAAEARWFPLTDLPLIHVAFDHEQILADALAGGDE
jgi:8-oxo-dGTP diphosphatase